MEKPKILHLRSSSGFYGAENVILSLAKKHLSIGCDVYIGLLCSKSNPSQEVINRYKSEGINVEIFNCNNLLSFKTVIAIRKFVLKKNINIVHSHGYKSNVYNLFSTLMIKGIKRISTCHTWYSTSLKMKIFEHIDKLLLRFFNKIVVVSQQLKDELIALNFSEQKVLFINNGIPFEDFQKSFDSKQKKIELGFSENQIIIGAVGRLSVDKGHIFLIKAMGIIKNYNKNIKCLIVGDGPEKDLLEQEIKKLKLEDNVFLMGIRSDIVELLSIMRVFVMPSLKEGMPIALLEAMSSGSPVIATDVGAIAKVIDNGVTGVLIETRDPAVIAETVRALLEDKTKAELLAVNAKEKVKNNFSIAKMAVDYAKVYDSLI